MRKQEQRLWDRMRAHRPPTVRLERIENGLAAGIPDVHALCHGVTVWVELKAREVPPARASTPLLGGDGLSAEQRNWHLEYARHGGRSMILIGVGKGRTAQQFLLSGALADDINSMPLGLIADAAMASDWPTIFTRMFERGRF